MNSFSQNKQPRCNTYICQQVCAFHVSTWSFTLREELTGWSETVWS